MANNVLERLSISIEGIFGLLMFCILIGILLSMNNKNYREEKKEALKMTAALAFGYLIINAFFDIIGKLVAAGWGDEQFSAMGVLSFIVIVFYVLYLYLKNAADNGKAAWHLKLYSNLEELEEWLNGQGEKGILCTQSLPEWYLFKMEKAAEKKIRYKAEYVSFKNKKEYETYREENEKKGWQVKPYGQSELSVISICHSDQADAPIFPADRHKMHKLNKKLTGNLIVNILLAVALIFVNIYVVPYTPIFQWFTVFVVTVCMIQIGLRVYFSNMKKADYLPEN